MFELLIIGIIALIVLGPERLLRIATRLGGWVRQGRELLEKIKKGVGG